MSARYIGLSNPTMVFTMKTWQSWNPNGPLRSGQHLFNSLPSMARCVVAGSLFDPFYRNISPTEMLQWVDEHLIFDADGEIIAVFNGNTILAEKVQLDYPYPLGPHLHLVCDKCNLNMHYCLGCGDELTHNEEKGINGSSHPCYHDEDFRMKEYGF